MSVAKSLQDILKHRQQEEFVGREEQLIFFRRNLHYEPDDDRRRFIISVSGQGGVGKTWLLHRFRKIAEECGAITAYTDETEKDIPGAIGRIAKQFADQDHPLKAFAERYKVYRQRRQEIEADPEAPPGLAAFLGHAAVEAGLYIVEHIPGLSLATRLVNKEAIASLTGDFFSYVARRIGNRDELQLVLEPIEVLTPLFLADLRKTVESRPIVLFFDAYERTSDFLDAWVRGLIEGRYGNVPANILLVIAGRDALDRNLWSPYERLLARHPLDLFTEEEARAYLALRGVNEEEVVKVILHLSGRLPLLVDMMATESPADPRRVGGRAGEAVARFLQWVKDPKQRQVALDAALPRWLNRDVLAVLVGKEEADAFFEWLSTRSFVENRGDGWAYHDVARAQMLRLKWQEAPQGWTELHGRLAGYYEKMLDDLGLEEELSYKDETWRRYALEALYHRLCQAPQKQQAALTGFLAAFKVHRFGFAYFWADTMCQVGEEVGVEQVQRWGSWLAEGVKAYVEGRFEETIAMFTVLLEEGMLETRWHATALDWRGYLYCLVGQYSEALADLSEAVKLAPEEPEYRADRGMTYRLAGRYGKALADLNRALELRPDYSWALANRGRTYRLMRRYKKALADFNQAVELVPSYAWAITSRGEIHWLLGNSEKALEDLNRAVGLVPDYTWALVIRGETYWQMGRYDKALADFNRAIELVPDYLEAIVGRGETYLTLNREEDALVDFDKAIELSPNYARAIAGRGETYRLMGRYKEALAHFDQAIELEPDYAWAIAQRGITHRDMKHYEEALADFNRVIELEPEYAWVIARRGETYRRMGRYKEALSDLNRAIELKPECDWCLFYRALAFGALNQMDRLRVDFNLALQHAQEGYKEEPPNWRNTLALAVYYLVSGESENADSLYRKAISGGASTYLIREAIRDLEDVLSIFPNHSQAQAIRDMLQKHLEEIEE